MMRTTIHILFMARWCDWQGQGQSVNRICREISDCQSQISRNMWLQQRISRHLVHSQCKSIKWLLGYPGWISISRFFIPSSIIFSPSVWRCLVSSHFLSYGMPGGNASHAEILLTLYRVPLNPPATKWLYPPAAANALLVAASMYSLHAMWKMNPTSALAPPLLLLPSVSLSPIPKSLGLPFIDPKTTQWLHHLKCSAGKLIQLIPVYQIWILLFEYIQLSALYGTRHSD